MYGYFRPFKPELKICEYEYYHAIYCGLCHKLSQKYGLVSRLLVNYDAASFAALLSGGRGGERKAELKRCPVNPFKKRPSIDTGVITDYLADVSVILFYRKLKDDISDGGFWKRFRARLLSCAVIPAYKNAVGNSHEYDLLVTENLKRLKEIEDGSNEPDRAADCFAEIVTGLVVMVDGEDLRRIYREMLYHIGRAIYYLDALDDLDEDLKNRSFNPLFHFGDCFEPETAKKEAEMTIKHSIYSAEAAANLIEWSPASAGLCNNLIFLGLQAMLESVLNGRDKGRKAFGPV